MTDYEVNYVVHVNLDGNEIRNFRVDNKARSNAVAKDGAMVYESGVLYYYDGTTKKDWIEIARGGDVSTEISDSVAASYSAIISQLTGSTSDTDPLAFSYANNKLTLTIEMINSEADVISSTSTELKLATGYAVKEYAQHKIKYVTDTSKVDNPQIGDVCIVPDEKTDEVLTDLTGRISSLESKVGEGISDTTITTVVNNAVAKLNTAYTVKGALTTQGLPTDPEVGDVWNINIAGGLDITSIKDSFIDPPTTSTLPSGTNIVYVKKTGTNGYEKSGWDIMGGTSSASYRWSGYAPDLSSKTSATVDGANWAKVDSAVTCTVYHNLGVYPTVQVFKGGERIIPAMSVSTTSAKVKFNSAPLTEDDEDKAVLAEEASVGDYKFTIVCTL